MPEDERADDPSLRNLDETLEAWMYEPVPREYFDQFSAELGGSPSIASPLEVMRLAVFWRSLPWRWHKIAEKQKVAEGEEWDLLSADLAILHCQHDVAREVIVAAAEAERMNSTPIIESDRCFMSVMKSFQCGFFVDSWTALWPDCLSESGRAWFAKEWPTLVRAETLLKRLEARMWVLERQERMPGGDPMERRAEGAPEGPAGRRRGRLSRSVVAPYGRPPRDKVFISYSHKDKSWLKLLRDHLKPYEPHLNLLLWDDSMIKAGERWRKEIQEAIATAKLALLLVSPNFLASEFIAKHELPPLLNAAKEKGVTIMWIPVSSCSYSETEIEEYQVACDPAKPLDALRPAQRNKVFVGICTKIKAALAPG